MTNPEIHWKLLPDGRVCIHWFVADPAGPIRNGEATVSQTQGGPLVIGGGVGRLACRPQQNSVLTQIRGNVAFPCGNSDDPRAVTCPDCMATEEYKKRMAELEANKKETAKAGG